MDWSLYASFLILATLLVLVPGVDFAVVTKNTLVGGRRRGFWCGVGVTSAAALQGALAAAGLGALLLQAEPVFQTLKWAGAAYLVFLGAQSLRSARAGRYAEDVSAVDGARTDFTGWRQGFLSNITNPKVLVFYVAVLPQFLGAHASLGALSAYAFSHAFITFVYLTFLTYVLHRVRQFMNRQRVRQALDALTGLALVGFGVRVALEK